MSFTYMASAQCSQFRLDCTLFVLVRPGGPRGAAERDETARKSMSSVAN
jgi:hypothetical protein